MPSLRQLQYLVSVADLLSFSRAAERLNVTQPTLSAQIVQLEARLGTTLFERTRARVLLTPQGAAIAARARDILRATEELRHFAREGQGDPHGGLVRLGVVPTIGAYLLSLAMPQIRRALPNLQLHLREDGAEALVQQLYDGLHEALVLPSMPERPDLCARRILREELQLVLPAGHPLSGAARVNPADLRGETVLTMAPGEDISAAIAALCAATGARLAREFEGTSLDTLRQMVATGMGVALLPALYIRSEVLREQLVVTRPLTHGAPVREVALVWRQAAPGAARYEALAEVMTAAVQRFDSRSGDPSPGHLCDI